MGGGVLMDIETDVLIIGGGMAGLVAGITAAQAGTNTIIVRKGQGATVDSSGAIDIAGYLPGAYNKIKHCRQCLS